MQVSLSPYFVKQFFSMSLLHRNPGQRRNVVAQLGDRIAFSVQGLFWDQFANTIMGLLQKVGFESLERVRASLVCEDTRHRPPRICAHSPLRRLLAHFLAVSW